MSSTRIPGTFDPNRGPAIAVCFAIAVGVLATVSSRAIDARPWTAVLAVVAACIAGVVAMRPRGEIARFGLCLILAVFLGGFAEGLRVGPRRIDGEVTYIVIACLE